MLYAMLLIRLNINRIFFFSMRSLVYASSRIVRSWEYFRSETIEEFISGGKMKLLIFKNSRDPK